MTFKKDFKTINNSGQSSIEYIILFAIIALITLIGVTSFIPQVKSALGLDELRRGHSDNLYNRAMQEMDKYIR